MNKFPFFSMSDNFQFRSPLVRKSYRTDPEDEKSFDNNRKEERYNKSHWLSHFQTQDFHKSFGEVK
jgi:hypothetical protein